MELRHVFAHAWAKISNRSGSPAPAVAFLRFPMLLAVVALACGRRRLWRPTPPSARRRFLFQHPQALTLILVYRRFGSVRAVGSIADFLTAWCICRPRCGTRSRLPAVPAASPSAGPCPILGLFCIADLVVLHAGTDLCQSAQSKGSGGRTRSHQGDLAELARKIPEAALSRRQKEDSDAPPSNLGKSARGEDDEARIQRAAASKGYKAAREMVYEAMQKRSTDIHLEPTKDEMTVRFRIDGILHAADPFSRGMGDAVLNIFKFLAIWTSTEKRKPQDGSFSARASGHLIDFRIAIAMAQWWTGRAKVVHCCSFPGYVTPDDTTSLRSAMRDQNVRDRPCHTIADQPAMA